MTERDGVKSAVRPLTRAEAREFARMLVPNPTAEQVKDVRERLTWVELNRRLRDSRGSSLTPSATRKELAAVRRAATRLLVRLGVDCTRRSKTKLAASLSTPLRLSLLPAGNRHAFRIGGYPDLPPKKESMAGLDGGTWNFRSDEKLRSIVDGVQLLIAWCDDAIALSHGQTKATHERSTERLGRTGVKARHFADFEKEQALLLIAYLYRDLSGRKPGIARPPKEGGKPGGPFVRFALAVCARMGVPMTADSLEKRWRRIHLD